MSGKLIGVMLGVATLATGVAVSAPAASATSRQWNLDYVAGSQPNLVQVGDTLTGSATLVLLTYLNGNPTHIICEVPNGSITHTVDSSDVLSGAPGDVLSFDATLPSTISTTSNGVCEDDGNNKDFGSGVPIGLTSLGASAPVTVYMQAPVHSPGDPREYLGTMTGWLGVPDSEFTFSDPTVASCSGTWPVVDPNTGQYPPPGTALPSPPGPYAAGQVFSGSYSGGLALDTADFFVTSTGGCSVIGSELVSSWKPIGSVTTYTSGIAVSPGVTVYWQ